MGRGVYRTFTASIAPLSAPTDVRHGRADAGGAGARRRVRRRREWRWLPAPGRRGMPRGRRRRRASAPTRPNRACASALPGGAEDATLPLPPVTAGVRGQPSVAGVGFELRAVHAVGRQRPQEVRSRVQPVGVEVERDPQRPAATRPGAAGRDMGERPRGRRARGRRPARLRCVLQRIGHVGRADRGRLTPNLTCKGTMKCSGEVAATELKMVMAQTVDQRSRTTKAMPRTAVRRNLAPGCTGPCG